MQHLAYPAVTASMPKLAGTPGVTAELAFGLFRGARPDVADGPIEPSTSLCPGLSVFHDAASGAVSLQTDPSGPVFEIAEEGGTYLSLSATLPPVVRDEIGPGRLLQVALDVETPRPMPVYLRLNLETQPEPVVLHDIIISQGLAREIFFNLDAIGYAVDAGLTGAWVDVIFGNSGGRRIVVRDLTVRVLIQGWPGL